MPIAATPFEQVVVVEGRDILQGELTISPLVGLVMTSVAKAGTANNRSSRARAGFFVTASAKFSSSKRDWGQTLFYLGEFFSYGRQAGRVRVR